MVGEMGWLTGSFGVLERDGVVRCGSCVGHCGVALVGGVHPALGGLGLASVQLLFRHEFSIRRLGEERRCPGEESNEAAEGNHPEGRMTSGRAAAIEEKIPRSIALYIAAAGANAPPNQDHDNGSECHRRSGVMIKRRTFCEPLRQ